MSRVKRHCHRAYRYTLRCFIALVVLVAISTMLGRHFAIQIHRYEAVLENRLSEALGARIHIEGLSGKWRGYVPQIQFDRLLIGSDQPQMAAIEVGESSFSLDVSESVWEGAIVFRHIQVHGLRMALSQHGSSWKLEGITTAASEGDSVAIDPLVNALLAVDDIELSDIQLRFLPIDKASVLLQLPILQWANRDQHRFIKGEATLVGQPSPVAWRLNAEGDPRQLETFAASAHVDIGSLDLQQLAVLAGFDWPSLTPPEAMPFAAMELWLTWQAQQGLNLRASAAVPWLPLQGIQEDLPPLEQLQLEIAGQYSPDGSWQIQLGDLAFRWLEQNWPNSFVDIRGDQSFENLALALNQVDLDILAKIAQAVPNLPAKLKQVIDDLSPSGRLENLHARVPLKKEHLDDFLLHGELQRVTARPWQGVPGVNGATGWLEASLNGGQVLLDSQSFGLEFPYLYDHSLPFDSARGAISWELDWPNHRLWVAGEHLQVVGEGRAKGDFWLTAPLAKDAFEGEIYLRIGVQDAPSSVHQLYVPRNLSDELLAWLQRSIGPGQASAANFMYHGSLSKNGSFRPAVQLALDVEQLALDYFSPWPALAEVSGRLLLDDRYIDASVDSAKLYDSQVGPAAVRLVAQFQGDDSPPELHLSVNGSIRGDTKDGLRFLQSEPIRSVVGDVFDSWQMNGDMTADLMLQLPLRDGAEPQYFAKVMLSESELWMKDLALPITDLNGVLNYHHQRGLTAESVTAQLWRKPLNIAIESDFSTDQLRIDYRGKTDLAAWQRWSNVSSLKAVDGVIPIEGQLTLFLDNRREQFGHLRLTTDLAGATVAIPGELGKSAEQVTPAQLDLYLRQSNQQLLTVDWLGRASMAFAMRQGQLDWGHIFIGSGDWQPQNKPGLYISGQIERFDYALWAAFFQQLDQWQVQQDESTKSNPRSESQTSPVRQPIRLADLEIEHFYEGDLRFDRLSTRIRPEASWWQIEIESAAVAGEIRLPVTDGVVSMDWDYLYLPDSGDEQTVETDPLADIIPADIPAIDLTIADFKVGDVNFGSWYAELRPDDNGLWARNMRAKLRGITINKGAEAYWWQDQSGQHWTHFGGRLSAKNLAVVLPQWQMEANIESHKAEAEAKVLWSGSPAFFAAERLQGKASIFVEDGRFLDIDSGTATLRVMSIFNFATYARRLRLDFSDLYQSGLHFDKVSGRLDFRHGIVNIDKPIEVEGVASEFRMSGDINLREETFDSKLVVTLPINSNLPWIAALSGGLPVAAGVFVVSKLLKSQVEQLSSASYRISGSWVDPSVEFESIFDNSDMDDSALAVDAPDDGDFDDDE